MNETCPVCGRPFVPDPRFGYILDGARTQTCEPCHGTLMQITLQSKFGMRKPFWSARSTEAMRKKVHRAILEAAQR